MIPHVRRLSNYHRVLTEQQLDWVKTLLGLKQCGMRPSEIKQYIKLCRQGNSTIKERSAMLDTKRRQLWQEIEELQAGINFIERKQEIFNQILENPDGGADEWC